MGARNAISFEKLGSRDILQVQFSQVPPGLHVVDAGGHFDEDDDGFDGGRVYAELFGQAMPANEEVWDVLGEIPIVDVGRGLELVVRFRVLGQVDQVREIVAVALVGDLGHAVEPEPEGFADFDAHPVDGEHGVGDGRGQAVAIDEELARGAFDAPGIHQHHQRMEDAVQVRQTDFDDVAAPFELRGENTSDLGGEGRAQVLLQSRDGKKVLLAQDIQVAFAHPAAVGGHVGFENVLDLHLGVDDERE